MAREEEAVPFLDLLDVQKRNGLWQRGRAWVARITRKQVAIAIGSGLLLVIFLFASEGPAVRRLTATSDKQAICSTARLNPYHAKAPLDPGLERLTPFWPELKKALDEYGPKEDVPSFDRPAFQADPPSDEAIRDRTSLLMDDEAALLRQRHAEFVEKLPSYPTNTFKGRGIVMLAGAHYSEYAATALGVLRESGSKLPVEVWRRDEREEKHQWCDELEAEGMVCRRLSDYLDTDILAIEDGKEMKVFTMLFSSFEEIIFIDADNMALQPPELLFDTKAYKERRAILWPDYWRYDNVDWLDYVVGISPNRSEALWDQTTAESGQVVWNKRQHWKALLLATYYNYHGPNVYYTLLNHGYAGWGDKDTLPLALRALGEPYYFVPHAPKDVWVNEHVDNRRMGMLQMAPDDGQEVGFFMHSTTIKWSHRDFMCVGCLPIWHTESPSDGFVSRYEQSTAELSNFLHGNIRILDPSILNSTAGGVDPETKVWRAMEYAACRSGAWSHSRTCEATRRYIIKTFGFQFRDAKTGNNATALQADDGSEVVPGMDRDVCLIDPT